MLCMKATWKGRMLKLLKLHDCFNNMKTKERKTKKRVLCGYTSAHQIHQHAKRMGSICLVMGTPYKEGVMGLSLDRLLDDMHHHPNNCLLIGTRLYTPSLQDLRHTCAALPGKWD